MYGLLQVGVTGTLSGSLSRESMLHIGTFFNALSDEVLNIYFSFTFS